MGALHLYNIEQHELKEIIRMMSKYINVPMDLADSSLMYIAKKEALEVILSGGVFQNKTLLELIINRFKKENIPYYYQQYTPINDSGISLGQIKYFLEKYSTI